MKHWQMNPDIVNWLEGRLETLNPHLVVDVGGQKDRPLIKADVTIGWEGDEKIDLERDRLPFGDKEVGFLFCRHTIEDLANPEHLLREIQRVAQYGYIETPSPLAETTRGVDAFGQHIGYAHHRWLVWSVGGVLKLLPKYPLLETMQFERSGWGWLQEHGPRYWNTYHPFGGELKFEILTNERDFQLCMVDERQVPVEYEQLVNAATLATITNREAWHQQVWRTPT